MRNLRKISLVVLIILLLTGAKTYSQVYNENSVTEITAEDMMFHIGILASDQLKGRLAGTTEGRIAAAYIANEFERFGLKPVGDENSYFQVLEFISGVEAGENNNIVVLNGNEQYLFRQDEDFTPLGFSSVDTVFGDVVFAGYGISAESDNYDDYAGLDVNGKIVLAFMFSPGSDDPDNVLIRHESVRTKAMTARQKGAEALIICYGFESGENDELPKMKIDQVAGDVGIPVVHVRRNVVENLFSESGYDPAELEKNIISSKSPSSFLIKNKKISLVTDVKYTKSITQNVLGYLQGAAPDASDRVIIIGAHYDHLGVGEISSMAPSLKGEVHNGADDNASGTAGLMELAQKFSSPENRLSHDLLFIGIAAEEWGLLGANHYVKNPVFPLEKTDFMMNLDMIGRMENNVLTLNGAGTSPDWHSTADKANEEYKIDIRYSEGGLGGSDHMPFYTKEIPVIFLFTGTHTDYHKPSDDIDKINPEGAEKIIKFAEALIREVDSRDEKMVYSRAVESSSGRPVRGFKVTLGIVPDFSGTESDGLHITDVVDGGPAAEIGLKSGDIIIKLAGNDIKTIYDYMHILGKLKHGQETEVVILRDGEQKTFKVVMRRRG